MKTRQHRAVSLAALIAVIGGIFIAPAPVNAQDVILSEVPKDPCCLTNFRYSGMCQVMPRQGQYCENILSYLNNFNSAGEAYCASTYIRGGWTLVDCGSGAAAGQIGYATPQPIEVHDPSNANVTSPTRMAKPDLPQQNTPRAIDSNQLQVADASVIQVRLERPLDGERLAAGQELTGRLEADVLGPDGEVIAPAGSQVSAMVGAEHVWDSSSASPGTLKLQLVGTTTSAADLFGTVEASASTEEPEAASIHLTGDLVELSQDSVLSFQLKDVSEQPADMRVLTTATAVWMEAFNTGDPVTIAGLASENGALLPPNGRAIVGRDAIYDYWKGLLTDSTTKLELINVETVVEGDLGYKAGRFELVDAATGTSVDQGKYIQIWKRSPQGYWELHRDMWNSSLSTTSAGS